MSNGADIAAEIHAALIEAGEAVGDGELICTLEKPGTGGPTTPWDATSPTTPDRYNVTAMEDNQRIRDMSGTLTGETLRTLTISAVGAVPEKDDRLAVGVASGDITADTVWSEIIEVRPLAPAGEALLYECDLGV